MDELVTLFKALSDETRLRIIKLLEKGELCVCDITAALNMVQPRVSFHLSALKEAALIKDRRQGKWIHYSLNEADMFRRMLVLTVCDRLSAAAATGDQRRLSAFLKGKQDGEKPDCPRSKVRTCEA
jgi:ArsR family transcriptional regulator